MSSSANLVRAITPPIVWHFTKRKMPGLVRALGGHYTYIKFSGDYPDFSSARRACMGYDDASILKKTKEALLKVKRGESRWEQDGMVSDSDELPWSMLAALLRIATLKGDRSLRVLDFGGSLGTTYFWCRPYLSPALQSLRWHVVEQPGHVAVGKAEFQDEELQFDETVEQSIARSRPDVLVLSGVLHFMPEPEDFLKSLLKLRIPNFILDRTMLWNQPYHRLTIQEVPPEIYAASYPAWFLCESRILALIKETYDVVWSVTGTETWELERHVVPSVQWQFKLRSLA